MTRPTEAEQAMVQMGWEPSDGERVWMRPWGDVQGPAQRPNAPWRPGVWRHDRGPKLKHTVVDLAAAFYPRVTGQPAPAIGITVTNNDIEAGTWDRVVHPRLERVPLDAVWERRELLGVLGVRKVWVDEDERGGWCFDDGPCGSPGCGGCHHCQGWPGATYRIRWPYGSWEPPFWAEHAIRLHAVNHRGA